MPVKNFLCMITNPEQSLRGKITEYDITEENWIFDEAKEKANCWIGRYSSNPRGDWAQEQGISDAQDMFNKTVGLMGEYIIDGCLDQFEVPHNWAKPSYPRRNDPRGAKKWDQLIAGNLSLEIKTNPPFNNYSKLIIDERSYMHCDYVIGVQLFHEKGERKISSHKIAQENWDLSYLTSVKSARLMGFLMKTDVEKIKPHNPFGFGDCRIKAHNELRPMNLFWITILQYSSDRDYRDLARRIIAENTSIKEL